MGMTTITVKAGQKPTKEQIKRIRAAAKARDVSQRYGVSN